MLPLEYLDVEADDIVAILGEALDVGLKPSRTASRIARLTRFPTMGT